MRKKLWMLAAILICGAMTMLTSCSVDDNPVDNNDTPMPDKLSGMYTVMLDDEEGAIGSNAYSMVLVAYDFKADGTGQWSELYYDDENIYPFMGNGGDAGGQFKYTIDDEGMVSFTFERPDMVLQRGTVFCLDEDLIALDHTKDDFCYFGSKQDEETANDIRTLMRQFNGGSEKVAFNFSPTYYGLSANGDVYTLKNSQFTEDVVDASISITKKSADCCLRMHGGTVTLDNYTGSYEGANPLINGMERDLTIILKGSSVIKVTGNSLGILTSGNIKLGGIGELKIITNAEGANHFGIQGANYAKDNDDMNSLAYDNVRIKRMDKVINEDGTCTWTYIVGDIKPLSQADFEDIGKPVSADAKVYPCLEDLNAAGATLAGMVACIYNKGYGLILSPKVSETFKSYDDAKAKVAAFTPTIAGCEAWHMPDVLEIREMANMCAGGFRKKPLDYDTYKVNRVEYVVAKLYYGAAKFSEKAVKAGIGQPLDMIIDYSRRSKRVAALKNDNITFTKAQDYFNNCHIRACAVFNFRK